MNGGHESRGSTPVVFDTVVLSNFAMSDSVEWLADRFERPWTVPAVEAEIGRGKAEGYGFLGRLDDLLGGAIRIVEPDMGTVDKHVYADLDSGETDALIVAIQHEGILASDDGAARDRAREYGVPVTGSIGVLADGVRRNELSLETAEQWLETWITDNGYYSPVESVAELLQEDDE